MNDQGEVIYTWDDVMDIVAQFRGPKWIFRGETLSGRPLKSSLERLAVDRWDHSFEELPAKIRERLKEPRIL